MSAPSDLVDAAIGLLKGIIKRPPLEPKLVGRPPFRFLRDVVAEVIKQTEYLGGLYEPEEIKAEQPDKAAKMAFLQKAIDAHVFATGAPVAAKPAKIVAGKESELTLEWLMAFAQAAVDNVDGTEAVGRVLAGERPSKSKSAKGKEGKPPKDERSREDRKPSAKGGSKRTKSGKKEKGSAGRARNARPPEASSKSRGRKEDGQAAAAAEEGGGLQQQPEPEPEPEGEPRKERPPSARLSGRKRPTQQEGGAAAAAEGGADGDGGEDGDGDGGGGGGDPEAEEHARAQAEAQMQAQMQAQAQAEAEEAQARAEAEAQQQQQLEEAEAELPGNVQRSVRQRERPTTARTGPPRSRRAGEEESSSRVNSAAPEAQGVQVFGDDGDDDGDDDDDDIFVEAAPDVQPTPQPMAAEEEENDGNDGALMRKIKEKKAAEAAEAASNPDIGGGGDNAAAQLNEAQRMREREAATKETERLREDIQNLCRSANPLGKIVDYIQEDVDAMRKEMMQWKKEHDENTVALSEEASQTEDELQPVMVKLSDLDQQIKDQEELIAAAKFQVRENDTKLQRMLESVALAAR